MVKELIDVKTCFRWCFEVLESKLFSKFSSLIVSDDSRISEISLVPNDDLDNVFVSMRFDLFDPVSDRLKAIWISDVEDKNDAVGSPVEVLSDGPEPLTACSVPDL